MARESQTSLKSPSFFQYGHCPLPATSHWTHLSISCHAVEAIHTLCYQPSPALLPHPPAFLQNHFFITSLHLCTVNKSSGLYLTDLKVNSNQVKCLPSWWKTVWLSWTDNWTDFNFAIISSSRGKKTSNNKKTPLLQENSRRGIFTVMWSHPACSSQPEDKNKLRGEYYEQQNKSGINRRYHSLICNT